MRLRSCLLAFVLVFALAGVSSAAAQALPEPQELLPSVDELPVGFEPEEARDVNIAGSNWSDSYRSFRRSDPTATTADLETLGLRVSVYDTRSGAEDWLQFSLWSLEREGYATSGTSELGEESYALRAETPDGMVTTGLLFRVGNGVGWATSRAASEASSLDTALYAAHLLESRLAQQVAFLND